MDLFLLKTGGFPTYKKSETLTIISDIALAQFLAYIAIG